MISKWSYDLPVSARYLCTLASSAWSAAFKSGHSSFGLGKKQKASTASKVLSVRLIKLSTEPSFALQTNHEYQVLSDSCFRCNFQLVLEIRALFPYTHQVYPTRVQYSCASNPHRLPKHLALLPRAFWFAQEFVFERTEVPRVLPVPAAAVLGQAQMTLSAGWSGSAGLFSRPWTTACARSTAACSVRCFGFCRTLQTVPDRPASSEIPPMCLYWPA